MGEVGEGFSEERGREHLHARVAWLYFIGAMTQQEIADHLGITRARVNKIIGAVRAEGAIAVELKMPLIECIDLEHRVKERFGLTDVKVVPSMPDFENAQRTVGEAAGSVLERLIPSGKGGIGIGWGRTLSFAARRVGVKGCDGDWVVGLMGALTRGSGTNTVEVATSLSRSLGVECHYLTAPIYCPSQEIRDSLLKIEELAAVMQRAELAGIALVACGDLIFRTPIGTITLVQRNLQQLADSGAVGEILGTFLKPDGEIIDHPLNRSVFALPLEKLREKPISILASGGLRKLPIIRAVLRGGYVNHLVTDESVARALVMED